MLKRPRQVLHSNRRLRDRRPHPVFALGTNWTLESRRQGRALRDLVDLLTPFLAKPLDEVTRAGLIEALGGTVE